MTKQSMLILAVIILIVLIGGLFVGMRLLKPTPAPQAEVAATSTPIPTENPMMKSSLKDLLGSGKTITCSYQEASISGTVFVADKKMRSDSSFLDSKGKSTDAHVLSDGEYTYMWTGTSGSKIKVSAMANMPSPSPAKNTSTQNLDQQLDMKCDTWTVDTTKFVIPTTVKFTDITAMMSSVSKTMLTSGMPKMDKSICDQITDPTSKEACLKALPK